MSQPIQVELLSDDEDDSLITPVSNPGKRPRFEEFQPNPNTFLIIDDDDPTPQKLRTPASCTPLFVPETPFSELPKPQIPPIFRCTANVPNTSFGSSSSGSGRKSPGVGGLICLESDDEAEGGLGSGNWWNNTGTSDVRKDSEKSPKFVAEDNWLANGAISTDFDVECLEKSPRVQSTSYLGNVKSTKTYGSTYMEADTNHILPFHDDDLVKENVRLDEESLTCNPKSRGKANGQKKQNKDEQAANRKKSQEEKMRLKEEKKLKKEQEKLHKAALKAEATKLRQLEKDKQRWEKGKLGENKILAEIDPKVVQLGTIGGHLLTSLGEKGLQFNITSNPIEKSIVWRMAVPEEISRLSSIATDVPYVLLIYDAVEFCKIAIDGSLMDHISSVRSRYPSYTICCLTNRLMSYINKREQEKYKNQKNASDWKRPPVEEVFAKLATHFGNVHSRQCADEAELAEHVVGLTINLAKCHFRKKLTRLSVNANGCNIPKDCIDRDLIMKHTWLKALVSIPKVQPRFAIAIWKKYPSMKSLLSVYMDPTKSVHEKEFLLKDLTTEGLLGNEERRVGEICSKRVYRVLMAQNGCFKTDDVEHGADLFTTRW